MGLIFCCVMPAICETTSAAYEVQEHQPCFLGNQGFCLSVLATSILPEVAQGMIDQKRVGKNG